MDSKAKNIFLCRKYENKNSLLPGHTSISFFRIAKCILNTVKEPTQFVLIFLTSFNYTVFLTNQRCVAQNWAMNFGSSTRRSRFAH